VRFKARLGCGRMDKPRAITAAAHKLARLIYTLLTRGQEYVDQSQDAFEARLPDVNAKSPLTTVTNPNQGQGAAA
jgi:hypothetical protein